MNSTMKRNADYRFPLWTKNRFTRCKHSNKKNEVHKVKTTMILLNVLLESSKHLLNECRNPQTFFSTRKAFPSVFAWWQTQALHLFSEKPSNFLIAMYNIMGNILFTGFIHFYPCQILGRVKYSIRFHVTHFNQPIFDSTCPFVTLSHIYWKYVN